MSEYVWIERNGRQVYCRVDTGQPPKRSALPCPMLNPDHIEPTRSMVDGKLYTSKAALRATYLPSGNATGDRYVEVGNESFKAPPKPKVDRGAVRNSVRKALSQVGISS